MSSAYLAGPSCLGETERAIGPLARAILALAVAAGTAERQHLADELLTCGRAIVLAGEASGEPVPLEGFVALADDIRTGRFAVIGDALLTIGVLPEPR